MSGTDWKKESWGNPPVLQIVTIRIFGLRLLIRIKGKGEPFRYHLNYSSTRGSHSLPAELEQNGCSASSWDSLESTGDANFMIEVTLGMANAAGWLHGAKLTLLSTPAPTLSLSRTRTLYVHQAPRHKSKASPLALYVLRSSSAAELQKLQAINKPEGFHPARMPMSVANHALTKPTVHGHAYKLLFQYLPLTLPDIRSPRASAICRVARQPRATCRQRIHIHISMYQILESERPRETAYL